MNSSEAVQTRHQKVQAKLNELMIYPQDTKLRKIRRKLDPIEDKALVILLTTAGTIASVSMTVAIVGYEKLRGRRPKRYAKPNPPK